MSRDNVAQSSPVLHVVVIGFHHKKGCQVDYSFPPLIEGNPVDSHDVPEEWKNLPSLALPDGAHNYTKDTIFFHLPARDGTFKTVYGVACYRQMDSSHLVNRTSDVTRSTVQKSVCVLSRLPLYGLIQAKLELITHAYFDERDFSKVELLEETYKNLSLSMTESLRDGSQVFLGMSTREVVMLFRHKIVLLFKLILLERRVLFSGAPVQKLCNTILAVLSLFPGMIEFGLEEAACIGLNKQLSPTLHSTVIGSDISDEYMEVCYQGDKPESDQQESTTGVDDEPESSQLKVEIVDPEHQVVMLTSRSPNLEPKSPEIQRDWNVMEDHPLQRIKLTSDDETTEDKLNIENTQNKDNDVDEATRNTKPISKHCDNEEQNTGDTDQKNSNENSNHSGVCVARSLSETDKNSTVISGMTPTGMSSSTNSKRTMSDGHMTNNLNDSKTVVYSNENELFASLNSMTQLSAVQTGQTFKQVESVVNIEDFSDTIGKLDSLEDFSDNEKESSKFEKSLNLEDAREVLRRSGSVEELDSPESIRKIDQEDCFSWEEDRLLLAIDHKSDGKDTSEDEEEDVKDMKENKLEIDLSLDQSNISPVQGDNVEVKATENDKQSTNSDLKTTDTPSQESSPDHVNKTPRKKAAALKSKLNSAFSGLNVKERIRSRRQASIQKESPPSPVEMKVELRPAKIVQDECGFPMAIFTKGCVCHPYLSLQYFDLLQDVNVRGFVLGATNILFRQKRHLTDVVIEVSDDNKIEFHARDLQRQLGLTTADHRFADIIVKAVIDEDSEDKFQDGTEWEGGDEWLQAQFRLYLQSLLVTLKQDDTKLLEDFGSPFIQAYKTTHNYLHWASEDHPGMFDIPLGHPCQGNLGMSDIRMRLTHNLQGTERGKKINAAMVQTGKYVEQAGKVVGGAITNARSAMSSWLSSFTQDWKKEENQDKSSENSS